ncbi:hypothetical protein [Chitinophaga vietnamensis]|nr:hypothetical protein [Chitinophaga vietnamensis]
MRKNRIARKEVGRISIVAILLGWVYAFLYQMVIVSMAGTLVDNSGKS